MRSRATGEAEGARTVAEGFLRVAIANMANAKSAAIARL